MKVWLTIIDGHNGYNHTYVSKTKQRAIDEIWHHFHRDRGVDNTVLFTLTACPKEYVREEYEEYVTLEGFRTTWVEIIDDVGYTEEIEISVTKEEVLS